MQEHTRQWQVLPAPPDRCQICAMPHGLEEPHNRQSLFYQLFFHQRYGRWPTWHDAIAHCPANVQQVWREALLKRGIALDA
jgi:hypothetical protein